MQLSWIFFNYIHTYIWTVSWMLLRVVYSGNGLWKAQWPQYMWQWHWDWVLDTSRKEQTFYTFRVEIGFCAKGVSLLGGLGACPSPQEIFKFSFSQVAFPAFWHHIFGIIQGHCPYHRYLWAFLCCCQSIFSESKREISFTTFKWPLWKIVNNCKLTVHKA